MEHTNTPLKAATKIIRNKEELRNLLDAWHKRKSKIVFTNGCFDLLHIGHLTYLEEARTYGDVLIIGLNSDASVQKLKGHNRPIIHQEERAMLLACLQFVDAVIIFDEETPITLIQEIQPDILIKGGDYAPEAVIGADVVRKKGGQTIILPFVNGFSTTSIIEKIQSLRGE